MISVRITSLIDRAVSGGRRWSVGRNRLLRCERGATIAEFGVAAALVVTAWGAVDSPRFQTIKETPCIAGTSRGSAAHFDKTRLEARLDARPCRALHSATRAS
ncbi:MAG: hypothetical protein JWN69_13 [Alphaproteobacteria bacterium]|nr:hypothetical protein [Alphaproteobacteria bacterium]